MPAGSFSSILRETLLPLPSPTETMLFWPSYCPVATGRAGNNSSSGRCSGRPMAASVAQRTTIPGMPRNPLRASGADSQWAARAGGTAGVCGEWRLFQDGGGGRRCGWRCSPRPGLYPCLGGGVRGQRREGPPGACGEAPLARGFGVEPMRRCGSDGVLWPWQRLCEGSAGECGGGLAWGEGFGICLFLGGAQDFKAKVTWGRGEGHKSSSL